VSNSQNEQPINLVPLSSLPAQTDLADMLRIAHLNPSRSVCLQWTAENSTSEHLLEAIILSTAADAVPEWNLYRLPPADAPAPASDGDTGETHVWTNRTDNLTLLFNLLTVEEKVTAPATISSSLRELAESVTSILSTPSASDSNDALAKPSNRAEQSTTGAMKPVNFRTEYTPIPATKAEVAAATSKRFTSSDLIAIDENALTKGVVLAGDLAEVELQGVLQSIRICKMSGRLDVRDGNDHVEVYFVDGELVHASSHSALPIDAGNSVGANAESATADNVRANPAATTGATHTATTGASHTASTGSSTAAHTGPSTAATTGSSTVATTGSSTVGTTGSSASATTGSTTPAKTGSAAPSISEKIIVGDQVLLDVLTWERGGFYFNPGRNTSDRSITRRLEGLLLEGASLRDFGKYLRGLGVNNECILEYRQCLPDADLEEKLKNAIPIDFTHQLKLYSAIDGKTNFGAVLKRLNMPRSLWMPILFNFFNYDLIALVSAQQPAAKSTVSNVPTVEQSIVKEAAKHLVRPETGLFSYALFLHFLQREYARYVRCRSAFAIGIFEIRNNADTLSDLALQKVAQCFESLKEPFDTLGHYRISELIMLLPLRDDRETRKFVESLAEKIKHAELDGVSSIENLRIACGIAAMPGGNDQLPSLLQEAEAAKRTSLANGILCTSSREVRWQSLTNNAEIALNARNYVEAELLLSAAFAESEHFPTDDPRVISTIDKLCDVLDVEEKYGTAEPMLSLKILLKTRSLGANHPEVLAASRELVRSYCQQAKYAEAETALLNLVEAIGETTGSDHLDLANTLYSLASVYQAQQKFDEAEAACDEAVEVLKQALGPDHPETVKLAKTRTDLIQLLKPTEHPLTQANQRNAAGSNQTNAQKGQLNNTPLS
jgi:GGDEF domain-containing protein